MPIKGRGVVNASKTRKTIAAGTILAIEKPYVGIVDLESERVYPEW